MVNKIFKKEWYKVDPFDRMIENRYSKNRYSKRHPIKMIIGKSFITYKNLEDEKILWKY